MEQQDGAGYARLYAPIAVFVLLLSFQSLFVQVEDGQAEAMDSVWGELRDSGAPEALLGAMLLVTAIVLLTVGAFGSRSVAVPIGVAITVVLMVLMILIRPGYGEPTPLLTGWGQAGVALGIATAALAVAHVLHLKRPSHRHYRA